MELSLAKPALLRKPLLLKDYLLDDLSSCSSSGFRSYPRRQCCTSVRSLLEVELKNKPTKYVIQTPPHKSPSKPSSAFQRASTAVINAVKSSSSLSTKLKLTLFPRSLSRKLLRRSFRKRPDHRREIQRWEPTYQLHLKTSPPPSDFTVSPTSGDSRSSTSDSNCKSNSWSDSDFTASDVSSGGNSTVEILNQPLHGVVSAENDNDKKRLPKDKVVSGSKRVGGIVGGDDTIEATTSSTSSTSSNNLKQCQGQEEENKEQFSPVSVLDCPFDDDDEVSSPFQHRLARMEGTKKRLIRKIKEFERLTQLEPVNLEKRIVLSGSDTDPDPDSDRSPRCHSSESGRLQDFIGDSDQDEANQAADKWFELLRLAKSTMPSICGSKPKADNYDKLLLDFFKEGRTEIGNSSDITLDHDLLNVAKDWIIGRPRELFLGWEVQKNRGAYIRDMERTRKWRQSNDEERQEVALELEVEVFASLVNELCHDLFPTS